MESLLPCFRKGSFDLCAGSLFVLFFTPSRAHHESGEGRRKMAAAASMCCLPPVLLYCKEKQADTRECVLPSTCTL